MIFWDCRSPSSYAIAMFNLKSRVDFISFYHEYHKYTANNSSHYEHMPLSVILSILPPSATVVMPTLRLLPWVHIRFGFRFHFRFHFHFYFHFHLHFHFHFHFHDTRKRHSGSNCRTVVSTFRSVQQMLKFSTMIMFWTKWYDRIWNIGRY